MKPYYIIAATDSASEALTSESHATEDAHASETTGHDTSTSSHEEEAQGIAALGIEPFAIGAQLITFLVLFWVVKKFALNGIVANLDKRHKDINRGLKLTAELDKQKAELDTQVTAVLRQSRKEADGIIADAHSESQRIIKAAEESAQLRVDEMMKSAEGKIEREVMQARTEMKSEMAQLITLATETILSKKLDTSSDRELIETYVREATQ